MCTDNDTVDVTEIEVEMVTDMRVIQPNNEVCELCTCIRKFMKETECCVNCVFCFTKNRCVCVCVLDKEQVCVCVCEKGKSNKIGSVSQW